jgi:hyperosmotically inducible periplasmic protein
MKKLMPLVISGLLLFGTAACGGGGADTASTTPGGANDAAAPVKEAAQKTEGAAKNTADGVKKTAASATGGVKTVIKNQLSKKIAGSKLDVSEKEGVVTVTGTVPTEADKKKIEPLIKDAKFQGVKSVKVDDVKVAK